MTNTLSNKYFLQALEAYPYDLSDTLEALEYAISYEPMHAAANCLMGQLYNEQLHMPGTAEYYFEQALIADISYLETYIHYSLLLIENKEIKKGMKLLNHVKKLKGYNIAWIHHRYGLIYECKQKYKQAKKSYKQGLMFSMNENERTFLENELKRVKNKKKLLDKSKKKRLSH